MGHAAAGRVCKAVCLIFLIFERASGIPAALGKGYGRRVVFIASRPTGTLAPFAGHCLLHYFRRPYETRTTLREQFLVAHSNSAPTITALAQCRVRPAIPMTYYGTRVCARSATASKARINGSGNVFPRFFARRRIPAHAAGLK